MNQKKMTKIISVIFIALFVVSVFPSQISGQADTTKASNNYTQQCIATFDRNDLSITQVNGYDTIRLAGDIAYLMTPGQPELPLQQLYITLPAGIKVNKVTVESVDSTSLPGEYLVVPAQPSHYFTSEADTAPSFDQVVYSSNQPWPSNVVRLVDQIVLEGQNIAVIEVFPLQYTPSERTLSFASLITFNVEGVVGEIIEETPQTLSLEAGDYDYVIITQESWMSNFQPLADWRIQRGITSKVVGRDWIYSAYTGTNQEKIRSFIIDAKNTWGTTAFLLGGDVTILPYYIHTVTIPGEGDKLICCDTFYANTNTNFYTSEVWVGRAPVTTTTEIATFINKIFTYEKNPPTSDYVKKAGLFAFDLDAQTSAEEVKVLIDNSYIPSNWSMSNVYDSHAGNHHDNVMIAINAGQHLLNHMDHSNYYVMGTGDYHHGWGLTFSDVNAFTNGDKQSIIYSCGCWAAAYDYNPCIAEKWMLNQNGGSVAFIGNTRYGWYTVGNPYTCSGRYDYLFYQSIFTEHRYTLGDAFTDHKNSYTPTDGYHQYVFTELTLLGDPEMVLWSENPEAIVVTHPTTLPIGSSSFTVHVEKTNGVDIQSALVVLWKGTEVYLTGTTNANGDVTLTPSPSTAGTMLVTVTKRNYLPYEGSADAQEQTLDPNQSFVTMTNENLPFLVTCPAGDGLLYQHVKVTCKTAGGNPLPGIPASAFIFTLGTIDAIWYGTLSCTFTPVDPVTNANGEIRFSVRGDTSIYGNMTIQATVQGIPLNDLDIFPCKSLDYDCNGGVSLGDFVTFASDYTKTVWRSDFTGDGLVGLGDFVAFAGHYTHQHS